MKDFHNSELGSIMDLILQTCIWLSIKSNTLKYVARQ